MSLAEVLEKGGGLKMTYPYNPSTSPKMRMSTIVTNTLDSKTYARTHWMVRLAMRNTYNDENVPNRPQTRSHILQQDQ